MPKFLVGSLILWLFVCIRFPLFHVPHDEGDEILYSALVEQLETNNVYSLHGHSVLDNPRFSRVHYDSEVFFHPPAGIFYFLMVKKIFMNSPNSFIYAQIIAFVIFYICMLLVLEIIFKNLSLTNFTILAFLCGSSPIFAHTSTKIWIENPRLAFFVLSFLLMTLACQGEKLHWIFLSLLVSPLACMSKVDSIVGVGLMSLFLVAKFTNPRALCLIAICFVINLCFVGWWLYYSQALKYGPGVPDAADLAANKFVHYIFFSIPSSSYLFWFAKIFATFPVGLSLIGANFVLNRDKFNRKFFKKHKTLLATLIWIFGIIAFYWCLSEFFGYAKLLRFMSLITPAAILLSGFALESFQNILQSIKVTFAFKVFATALLLIACASEITHGVSAVLLYHQRALIIPMF